MTPSLHTAAHIAPAAAPVWAELHAHRGDLLRFARRRLADPAQAEDVVHDVFEAVLSGRAVYGARASLRSWLTGVLKHKIIDLVRAQPAHDSLDDDDGGEDGHARMLRCPRPHPEALAEQRELLALALARIEALPAGLRDVMRLRVLEDESTDHVCAALGISEDNLFVRMHRARKQLAS